MSGVLLVSVVWLRVARLSSLPGRILRRGALCRRTACERRFWAMTGANNGRRLLAGAGLALVDRRHRAHAPSAEDLGLLRRELLLGEDALVLERSQVLELLDRVLATAADRGRGRGRGVLLGRRLVGLLFLCGPPVCLAAADAVRDSGGGTRHRGSAGHSAEESWHVVLLPISLSPRRPRVTQSAPASGCAGSRPTCRRCDARRRRTALPSDSRRRAGEPPTPARCHRRLWPRGDH